MTSKEKAREAKAYLQRVAFAEREIKTLKARIAHYEDLGLSITAFRTDTPVIASKGASRVEMAAVGIVDSLGSLDANLRAYEAIVRDAEKLIAKMPQENYRRLLTLRYLCGMSFRSISDEMRYTDRNSVYRAHGWALMEFGKVLNNEK